MATKTELETGVEIGYIAAQKKLSLQDAQRAAIVMVQMTNGAMPKHPRRILSKDARARIAEAQRKRWAKQRATKDNKIHWTQRPENKARVAKHLKKMRAANR